MSLVEQARTRLEETRDRIKTRVESVRGGGSSSSSNPGLPTLQEIREKGLLASVRGSSSNPELLKEIREKGVLSVLEDKFPRVKEIREGGGILGREGGILGRGAGPLMDRVRERGILGGGSAGGSSAEGTEGTTLLEEKEPHIEVPEARILL